MQTAEESEESTNKQLRMTSVTWNQLLQKGISESMPIVIELFFFANDETSALELAEILKNEMVVDSSYIEKEKIYVVEAKASPKIYSLPDLLKLVRQMCDLAFNHRCKFDGWGVAIPLDREKKSRWKFW